MAKDGLTVIVTGSASGLGAASAAMLATEGARLVINYSSSQKEAEQTAGHEHDAKADADRSRFRQMPMAIEKADFVSHARLSPSGDQART